MMRIHSSSLFSFLCLVPSVWGQPEWTKPENYEYDEPVLFNQWCDELTEVFGPSCRCTTTYGERNNIFSVDLDHEINCDPLQGNTTCIDGITIEGARVWLKATSIGYVDDFQRIKETAIRDFYIWLDDTSLGTISFRFNDNIGQRRTGCEAVFGAVNCARCGICDAPPHNKTAESPNHLGPMDVMRGISGQCRYGNTGLDIPGINLFNTCEDGPNILTRLFWEELEIRSINETGACPSDATIAPSADLSSSGVGSVAGLAVALASLTAMLV